MRAAQVIGLVVVLVGLWQASALANCPSGYPNEIFCDDFDTYCNESTGGHPGDPKCPATGANYNNQRLSEVWLREPRAFSDGGTGVEVIVETDQKRLLSAPYGGRYPCQGDAQYSPQTVRNWVDSPLPLSADGQIRNLAWKIGQVFGAGNTAVVGTDDQPLVLDFMMDGGGSDKIDFANGYMAVTLDDNDENNRGDTANTNFAYSPDCNTYCNPYIQIQPMPIMCAQGNPLGALPAGCPDVTTNPPPLRNVIAAGTLGMMDPDPCHCGSTTAHGPTNNHLNLFDGQKWWMLRSNNPFPSTGTVTPKGGAPMPPASTIPTPGSFDLGGGSNSGKSYNWVTLSIKTSTVQVFLMTQDKDPAGNQYFVTSQMEIPRAYLGAFNSLRMGVDEGCEILGTSSNVWACGGSNTKPLRSRAAGAGTLAFDDIYFHGGAPITEEGACCHPDASCGNLLPEQCDGVWHGRSTSCETLTEECCPKVYGDTDGDADVDIADFALLQRCLTTGGDVMNAACRCLDFNANNAIDSLEIEHFISCATGPSVPGTGLPPCQGVGW